MTYWPSSSIAHKGLISGFLPKNNSRASLHYNNVPLAVGCTLDAYNHTSPLLNQPTQLWWWDFTHSGIHYEIWAWSLSMWLLWDLFYCSRPSHSKWKRKSSVLSPLRPETSLMQTFCAFDFFRHCPLKNGSLAAVPSAFPLAGDKSLLTITMARLSDSH